MIRLRRSFPLILAALALLSCSARPPTISGARRQPLAGPAGPTPWAAASLAPTPSPTPAPTVTATPAPTLTRRPACILRTGAESGKAWLRAGPSKRAPALGLAFEGDSLLILSTPTPAGAAWLPVQAGELAGWVYSPLCEVTP